MFVKRQGIPMTKSCGVYSITNTVNGKSYIGSSLSIRGRLLCHRSYLRLNQHDNSYLQRAWNKFGASAFKFDVVKLCEPSELLVQEQYWIDKLQTANRKFGYNLAPYAGKSPMQGRNHTEEARAKMSKKRKGMDTSCATEAARKANLGVPRTELVKKKISRSQKGRVFSEEHKRKMRENHWTKRPGAAEIIARTASILRGRKLTDLHKERISQGLNRAGIVHATCSS